MEEHAQLESAKRDAMSLGFVGVRTLAGARRFEDWTPYGRKLSDGPYCVDFYVDADAGYMRERPKPGAFVGLGIFGAWPLVRSLEVQS